MGFITSFGLAGMLRFRGSDRKGRTQSLAYPESGR